MSGPYVHFVFDNLQNIGRELKKRDGVEYSADAPFSTIEIQLGKDERLPKTRCKIRFRILNKVNEGLFPCQVYNRRDIQEVLKCALRRIWRVVIKHQGNRGLEMIE